jgi:hypothetical protein
MSSDLREFLGSIGRDTVALLSGVASVILSAASATGLFAALPKWLFWAAAAMCFVFAAFRVWQKEHHLVLELREEVPLRIEVHGIPALVQEGTRPFFVVPEVTIANRAHGKRASVGAVLWAKIGGGGEAYCPPETKPLNSWERSRRTYTNRPMTFPLNLDPRQTAHGYVAFSADNLNGVAHERIRDDNGLLYYATRVIFYDYLQEEPEEHPLCEKQIRIYTQGPGIPEWREV